MTDVFDSVEQALESFGLLSKSLVEIEVCWVLPSGLCVQQKLPVY